LYLLVTALAYNESSGTLILSIYTNHKIYVAADSLVTTQDYKQSGLWNKVFKLSPECCVALGGSYGGTVLRIQTTTNMRGGYSGAVLMMQSTTNILSRDLCTELATICSNLYSVRIGLQDKITNCINLFSNKYAWHKQLWTTNPPPETNTFPTCLIFQGYDENKGLFIKEAAFMADRNTNEIQTPFHEDDPHHPPAFIAEFGDYTLAGLVQNRSKCEELKIAHLYDRFQEMRGGQPVSEQVIKESILEMFAVVRTNSGPTLIGPPYRIYRVDTNGVAEIN
jgi:hypothetical protein